MEKFRDLHQLSTLVKGKELVFSARPGRLPVWSYDDPVRIGRMMAWTLVRTVEVNENRVKSILMSIYDRPVDVRGRTSDLVFEIKSVTQDTGKTITEVILAIRRYLGYRCTFTTREGKFIPIERIKKAYLASAEGRSTKKIKQILYSHK